MQKPILILYMAIVACMATVLFATQNANYELINNIIKGIHPKTESLVITCPSNVIFYVDENCVAQIELEPPSSSCTLTSLSYTIDGGPSVPVTPGISGFPTSIDLGTYSVDTIDVVWTITDDCIPPANEICPQQIFIQDTISPTIICPGDVSVGNDLDGRNPLISLDQPTGNDNCGILTSSGILSIINSYNNTDDATDEYPLGTTIVVWVITDVNGNTASCIVNVVVYDNTPPVLSCPPTINVSCEEPAAYANLNLFIAAGGSAMDDVALDSLSFRLLDETSDNLTCPETIVRRYVIADTLGNKDTCNQLVIIHDLTPPTAICKDITVSLDTNGEATLTASQLNNNSTDNCGGILSFSTVGGLFFGCNDIVIGAPPVSVILIVSDACGNTSTCTSHVTVKDNISPQIACPTSITVDANLGFCYATNVVLGSPVSSDNCAIASVVPVFGGNVVTSSTQFPVGSSNIVTWTFADVNGNTASCPQNVTVIDKLAPSISNNIPDISISCEYPLDLNNLNVFGTFSQVSPGQNIVINDPGNPFYPSGIAGQNGVFQDNCSGSVVTVTSRNLLGMCNTGEIKRDFIITDIGGNTTSYTQTIYVIDVDKFDVNDITWPNANVDYFFCNETNPNTAITGVPVLNSDHCTLVAATYSDQTFNNSAACSYVKRTWTVLDWCQYQTNSGSNVGKWFFIQNIYIKNTVAPTITPQTCRDTTICFYTANCNAPATFTASGSDDCIPVNITWSYKIDLNNNGGTPDLTGNGASVSGVYNEGTHKLTWEAKDKCGNISTCSLFFTIKDCKTPSPFAMQGLATNLVLPIGLSSLKAKSFNNFSSDNCTASNQLRFSYSSNVNDTLRTFNCDSLGQRLIHLWVTDNAGNQSKTSTYIIVQDNDNLCGLGNKVNIVGKVFTEDKIAISDTKVMIDGGETDAFLVTTNDGQYFFNDLAKYNNYELSPVKDTNHIEGITTLDLVMIQRHILGIRTLESPYKIIAADVNNSQTVTGSDLVELRKMILGIQSKFSKNTSWRFVDASFKFSDPSYPWPFLEKLNYTGLETNMGNSDFIAVKIGDVNNSSSQNYTGKIENRSRQRTNLIIDQLEIKAGELVSIPIKSDNLDGLTGLQWTFELSDDLEYEGFEAEKLNFRNENISEVYRKGKKYLTVSYDDLKGIKSNGLTTLFNLNVRAKKVGNISSMLLLCNDITKSVAYDLDDVESDISLSVSREEKEYSTTVMQNHPNPFNTETSIKVQMKEKGNLSLTIYDGEGSLVYKNTETLNSGNHSLTINESQLGSRYGIFYCKIKGKDLNEVIKILRVE